MLAGLLDDFKDAVTSGFSGSPRPANLQAGGLWIDTTFQTAPNYYWAFKLYTGVSDIEIFRISIVNGFGGALTADSTFTTSQISDDAVGAVLNLVKNRVLGTDNGEVLNGDVVAELRFTGQTNSNTAPTLAYVRFTASDDMDGSANGGTFAMYSTADNTSTLASYLQFITGLIEIIEPLKLNSLQMVSQAVATTASINKLSASSVVVEFTGSTATDLRGIDGDGATWKIFLHNRSTANVTLKNENSTASAADRLTLPKSSDLIIGPQRSASLFYCATTSRWKIEALTSPTLTKGLETLNGAFQQWTVPANVKRVRLVSYSPLNWRLNGQFFLDAYGNAFALGGSNSQGDLGVGDVTPRSSPVAVLGAIKFGRNALGSTSNKDFQSTRSMGLLGENGTAYMWGYNGDGELGVGDFVNRSSPVAVSGTVKFSALISATYGRQFALAANNTMYAWGLNTNGQLGLGDNNTRSTPTMVLGNLRVSRVAETSGLDFQTAAVCVITTAGDLYAWGNNSKGQLGVGDILSRSSPVVVPGSIKWKKIKTTENGLTGNGSSFGLATDGTMYCWGENANGQLGVGDVISRSSPVAVLGSVKFYDFTINTFGNTVFAWTTDGTVYSWGSNSNGLLGLGDLTSRSSPVAVLGSHKFSYINSFINTAWGIGTDGTLYAWGDGGTNIFSGVISATDRSSPVAVMSGIQLIVADNSNASSTVGHARALTNDGVLYSWGDNQDGALGIGTVVSKTPPTAVVGAHGVAADSPVADVEISVNPGDVINVVLSQGTSFFGTRPLGNNIDRITIEYDIQS